MPLLTDGRLIPIGDPAGQRRQREYRFQEGLGQTLRADDAMVRAREEQQARNANLIAPMVIRQFEAIPTPYAQMVVQAFKQDPARALLMSNQFGGLGKIYDTARSPGPEFAKVDPGEFTPESLQNYWLSGNPGLLQPRLPADAKALQKQQRENAELLRKNFRDDTKPYRIQENYWDKIVTADIDNPITDFALVQAYGKIIDPSSVVREGEAGFIVSSGLPWLREQINNISRNLTQDGRLPAPVRRSLIEAAEAAIGGAREEQRRLLGEYQAEADALGLTGRDRELAFPPGVLPRASTFDYSQFEGAPQGTPGGGMPPGDWEFIDATEVD